MNETTEYYEWDGYHTYRIDAKVWDCGKGEHITHKYIKAPIQKVAVETFMEKYMTIGILHVENIDSIYDKNLTLHSARYHWNVYKTRKVSNDIDLTHMRLAMIENRKGQIALMTYNAINDTAFMEKVFTNYDEATIAFYEYKY